MLSCVTCGDARFAEPVRRPHQDWQSRQRDETLRRAGSIFHFTDSAPRHRHSTADIAAPPVSRSPSHSVGSARLAVIMLDDKTLSLSPGGSSKRKFLFGCGWHFVGWRLRCASVSPIATSSAQHLHPLSDNAQFGAALTFRLPRIEFQPALD